MAMEIRTAPALISIDRTPSRLELQTRHAKLELHQKHAKINIRTELPKVIIDQYECFASAGRKGTIDLTKEIAQRAYQGVIEFIGETAADGNRLAAIEKGGNPIKEIAVREAWPQHEFGYDFIPKARPKIDVEGSVQIDPVRNGEGIHNGVEGNYIPGDVSINFTPAKIHISMKQYPTVNIRYLGEKVDTYI